MLAINVNGNNILIFIIHLITLKLFYLFNNSWTVGITITILNISFIVKFITTHVIIGHKHFVVLILK